eukprot:jgi/Hompol1/5174/HPOL_001226-RA
MAHKLLDGLRSHKPSPTPSKTELLVLSATGPPKVYISTKLDPPPKQIIPSSKEHRFIKHLQAKLENRIDLVQPN